MIDHPWGNGTAALCQLAPRNLAVRLARDIFTVGKVSGRRRRHAETCGRRFGFGNFE
jgi:hypothetical protein